jgi:hypothetical protein
MIVGPERGVVIPAPTTSQPFPWEGKPAMHDHPIIPGVRFKDIDGFPGYCVGDDGSVWSRRSGNSRGPRLDERWHRLIAQANPARNNYLHVQLCRNGKASTKKVHALVLNAFVGPPAPGMEACHDPDPDPSNNKLSNLRWDTRKANAEDCTKHGRQLVGSSQNNAKLDEAKALEIRAMKGIESQQKTAKRHGVSQSTISRVQSGDNWKHI